MANYINQFFFGIYPYIAITVFFLGSLLRYDRDQYTWKASSSQMLSKKDMRLGSNLFHIGIIALFFGHLMGLLTPHWAYHFMMSAGTKQMVAMTAGGIFGLICLVGMILLIRRRMLDARIKATSQPTDLPILLILFVQLVLGLLTIPFSAQHLDGSSMLALASWAQHIVTFQGDAASFVIGEAFIFKIHLVLGLTIFLVFPFTRLVHVWSVPIQYLTRRGYQIVRKRG
ncbi:MAG: respiratory nitrate reductase subunit gamma [Xanthomonadales bacterium]|nr:respiratory nitrate reductase subunit gamma [Xanthomonadales bacterium]MDH4020018.1 respiratory nitrate reductase subunit gamma [Xanthomonadales bacterium]